MPPRSLLARSRRALARRRTVLAALLLGSAVATGGQEPLPGVEVGVVRLDVVVTDPAGAPVPPLAPGEIQVLEDGKPQRVTQFIPGRPRAAGASEAPSGADAEEAPLHLAIVADDLHLAQDTVEEAKAALQRFVAAQAETDTRIAFVATSAPRALQPLTEDRAVLRQAIARLRSQASNVQGGRLQLSPAQAELILRGDQSALRLATRLVMDEPGSMLTRDSPRATIEGRDGGTPAGLEPEEKSAAREAEREARAVLGAALRTSERTLATLDSVLRGMAPLGGRKQCVLVSDGFLVGAGTSEEQTQLLRRVTDAATRSGTAVHVLDSRRLAPTSADASVLGPVTDPGLRERVGRLTREESLTTLQRLAGDTGGALLGNLADALERVLADDRAAYLLAYEPSNTKRDGRFRRIEVRVPGRPELRLRARKGYFAPSRDDARSARAAAAPLPSLVAADALPETAMREALASQLPARGVELQLGADYVELPPDGPELVVQMGLDANGLAWRYDASGRRAAEVVLIGEVRNAEGPVGAPFAKRITLDLSADEHRRALAQGLRYTRRVPASPGLCQVRVVAREGEVVLGGALQSVEVPDLAAKRLALSSLFVSSAEGASPNGAEVLHEAQLRRHFRRSDSLYFQVYVYNPARRDGGGTDVVLQAQIRKEGAPIAASRPVAVAFLQRGGVPLPESNGMGLSELEPGGYELRVVVVDRVANATLQRSVDFTVE